MASSNLTIQELILSNFKGYRHRDKGQPAYFDFDDADLIFITGKNGVGKTSILQALDCYLNQKVIPNKFLTEKEKTGFVSINGEQIQVAKEQYQDKGLASVSTFFFQEHVARLACAEVIELLEPDNKPGILIKEGLKKLQGQLESWQLQLQRKAYRKDYEVERKKLAIAVTELTQSLREDFAAKAALTQSTLIINGSNFQNNWQSQLRNLSSALSKISKLPEVIGENIAIHLEHISNCITNLNDSYKSMLVPPAKSEDIYRSLLEQLSSFPENLEIVWKFGSSENSIDNKAEDLSSSVSDAIIIVESVPSFYDDKIKSKITFQEDLRVQYRKIQISVENLGEIQTIDSWLDSLKANIESWSSVFDLDSDKLLFGNVTHKISSEIEVLNKLTSSRLHALNLQRAQIEQDGKNVAFEIQQLRRSKLLTEILLSRQADLQSYFWNSTFKISDLISFYRDKAVDVGALPTSSSVPDLLPHLVDEFKAWSKLEYEFEIDQQNAIQEDTIQQANEMLKGAIKVCKQESGANSQLLNLMGEIPAVELERLTTTMNSLLDKFHFPKDFLPISLVNMGSDKKPDWSFQTINGVKFDDLSTGQKTQLAICWTINLNLALTDTLNHRVIGFDDFTTSLDMNQLIPAAVLLRKMAYADRGDRAKRQVIVTSHHEDLTNRLLDLLLPPNGYKMRVIQFEDWSPEKGPKFRMLKVDLGEQNPSGTKIASAVKRSFSTPNEMV